MDSEIKERILRLERLVFALVVSNREMANALGLLVLSIDEDAPLIGEVQATPQLDKPH